MRLPPDYRSRTLILKQPLDLKAFFERVPDLLLGPDSRFGFFNGLGATSACCLPSTVCGFNRRAPDATFYDVYTRLSELHLADVGIDVEWSDVQVPIEGEDEERWGNTRKYFTAPIYRLPVGRMWLS